MNTCPKIISPWRDLISEWFLYYNNNDDNDAHLADENLYTHIANLCKTRSIGSRRSSSSSIVVLCVIRARNAKTMTFDISCFFSPLYMYACTCTLDRRSFMFVVVGVGVVV